MAIKVFDPNQIGVIVGVSAIQGFAEDSMLAVDNEDAKYGITSDVHGDVTRFRQNKNIAKVTLTLTQSSPSNDVLSSFLEADRKSNAGVFNFMIKDNSGTTLFTSVNAYVEKQATVEFGNDNKNREWTIICINPSNFVGGVK
jgi:hypothetical protein